VPNLFALLHLNLEELVHGFLVVQRVHKGQVDHPAKVNDICARLVLDTLLFGGSICNSISDEYYDET
jgi:hypothetical protein